VQGSLAQGVAIQFHATDPALYAFPTQTATVASIAAVGGFAFNLAFPLSFGGGIEYSAINAANNGDLPCWPIITFTATSNGFAYPTLTNGSIVTNPPYIQFGVTMSLGDTLTVVTDPKYRSATYTSSGSSVGSPVEYTLTQGSTWFSLTPGTTSQLQFTCLAGAGNCTAEWASAYSAAY
jgi:hypothetical protein